MPADPPSCRPCIEIRSLLGNVKSFTVETYEAAVERASHLGSPRALAFWELRWTVEAPAVEGLTREWVKCGLNEFRISEWEPYAAQMDRLLGIAD